jgi:hypothetical protein
MIRLKNLKECFDWLSMNGASAMISTTPPFVLRFSKDERKVFRRIKYQFDLASVNDCLRPGAAVRISDFAMVIGDQTAAVSC